MAHIHKSKAKRVLRALNTFISKAEKLGGGRRPSTRSTRASKTSYYLFYWEGGRKGWRKSPKQYWGPFDSRAKAQREINKERKRYHLAKSHYQIVTEPTWRRVWNDE